MPDKTKALLESDISFLIGNDFKYDIIFENFQNAVQNDKTVYHFINWIFLSRNKRYIIPDKEYDNVKEYLEFKLEKYSISLDDLISQIAYEKNDVYIYDLTHSNESRFIALTINTLSCREILNYISNIRNRHLLLDVVPDLTEKKIFDISKEIYEKLKDYLLLSDPLIRKYNDYVEFNKNNIYDKKVGKYVLEYLTRGYGSEEDKIIQILKIISDSRKGYHKMMDQDSTYTKKLK